MEELKAKIIELENEIKLLKESNSSKKQNETEKVITSSCKCEICGKELKNKYILKTHMKLHQDKESRKQQCPICSKYYLNKHMINKHDYENMNEPETQNLDISSDSNSDVSSNETINNEQ